MSTQANPNSDMQASTQDPHQESWYVVQQETGQCAIANQLGPTSPKTWGPFASRSEAIAKRVGLIRAGKCLPA